MGTNGNDGSMVRETSGYEKPAGERSHKYPLLGSYTVDDYFALPDEQRVELIDGVFYDMASPTILHQDIIFYFQIKIYQYISEKKKPCKVIQAPLDVQLDEDDRTMVCRTTGTVFLVSTSVPAGTFTCGVDNMKNYENVIEL